MSSGIPIDEFEQELVDTTGPECGVVPDRWRTTAEEDLFSEQDVDGDDLGELVFVPEVEGDRLTGELLGGIFEVEATR